MSKQFSIIIREGDPLFEILKDIDSNKKNGELKSLDNLHPKVPKNVAKLVNHTHPSYDVHEAICQTLKQFGDNFYCLSPIEQTFLRAYEFDSIIVNSGLENYFYSIKEVSSWQETLAALEAIGAASFVEIFREILVVYGEAIIGWLENPDEMRFFDLIPEDYDQMFWDARPGEELEDKLTYVETLLDEYVVENYPWA